MRNEYEKWLGSLHKETDKQYYNNIVKFAPFIAEDMEQYKHHVMAKKLNMTASKLSILKPLIYAIVRGA